MACDLDKLASCFKAYRPRIRLEEYKGKLHSMVILDEDDEATWYQNRCMLHRDFFDYDLAKAYGWKYYALEYGYFIFVHKDAENGYTRMTVEDDD